MSRHTRLSIQDENRGLIGGRPKPATHRAPFGTITNGQTRAGTFRQPTRTFGAGAAGVAGVGGVGGVGRTHVPTRRTSTTLTSLPSARGRPSAPLSSRRAAPPLSARASSAPEVARAEVERITEETRSPHMDTRHAGNVMRVADLTSDIFEHLRNIEGRHLCDPNYLSSQTDINEKMRSILVDWIVDVCKEFKLLPDTFYLAVNIIDRYLSHKRIARNKLQLLGVTAMLLASKYEEIYAPEVRDFVYISARAYQRDEILRFERHVLSTMQFNLTVATCNHFYDRFCQAAGANARQQTLVAYLMHAAQHNYALSTRFLPSVQAAAAVYLARRYLGVPNVWTPELEHYTRYRASSLQEAVRLLNDQVKHLQTSRLRALAQRFSTDEIASFAMARASALTDL